MLNQRLQQKLLQKLSPQQVLLMRLLQLPAIALEQRIKEEMIENPALEETAEEEDISNIEDLPTDEEKAKDDDEQTESEEQDKENEFELEDYLEDDEIPYYKTADPNRNPDQEERDIPFVSAVSFQDYLISQLGLQLLDDRQYQIGLTIVGNLDDSGYLQRIPSAIVDDLAFSQNLVVSEEEVEQALAVIQGLDPAGVGARNLQECLLLQLKRKPLTPPTQTAIDLLNQCFDDFSRKHYDKIILKMKITEQELKLALEEIRKLNPKPGNSMVEVTKQSISIVPEFFIQNLDGTLELSLNNQFIPELTISQDYLDMLKTYSETGKSHQQNKEAAAFIRQKVEKGKWFIDAIRQRQITLFTTMKAIMEYQKAYFLTGDETRLRPMTLKNIAQIVRMDISTISRVANSKYVQTSFGTFLLKTLFSEGMQNTSGEEISTREIKKILSDCIEKEEKLKPFTDEELVDILKEKGYSIARRTVAKYREQLDIPVARLRKQL